MIQKSFEKLTIKLVKKMSLTIRWGFQNICTIKILFVLRSVN